MDAIQKRNSIAVILLMTLTGLVLTFQKDVLQSGQAAVRQELPDAVGTYRGTTRLYCQDERCPGSYTSIANDGQKVCPICGSSLDTVSLAEKRSLPPDTTIIKKQYTNPEGENVSVVIVLSGKDQKSIHRPQQCLPAQGYTIENSSTIDVPVSGRKPLSIRMLDLREQRSRTGTGKLYGYAYWFLGKGRETSSHWHRLFWMATDRMFRRINHRWAFVAVATERTAGSETHIARLNEFLDKLYPLIVIPDQHKE